MQARLMYAIKFMPSKERVCRSELREYELNANLTLTVAVEYEESFRRDVARLTRNNVRTATTCPNSLGRNAYGLQAQRSTRTPRMTKETGTREIDGSQLNFSSCSQT